MPVEDSGPRRQTTRLLCSNAGGSDRAHGLEMSGLCTRRRCFRAELAARAADGSFAWGRGGACEDGTARRTGNSSSSPRNSAITRTPGEADMNNVTSAHHSKNREQRDRKRDRPGEGARSARTRDGVRTFVVCGCRKHYLNCLISSMRHTLVTRSQRGRKPLRSQRNASHLHSTHSPAKFGKWKWPRHIYSSSFFSSFFLSSSSSSLASASASFLASSSAFFFSSSSFFFAASSSALALASASAASLAFL